MRTTRLVILSLPPCLQQTENSCSPDSSSFLRELLQAIAQALHIRRAVNDEPVHFIELFVEIDSRISPPVPDSGHDLIDDQANHDADPEARPAGSRAGPEDSRRDTETNGDLGENLTGNDGHQLCSDVGT